MERAEAANHGGVAQWFFGIHDRWPEQFPQTLLNSIWGRVANQPTQELRVQMLRAELLKQVRVLVDNCTRCDLAQHRLDNMGVLDDSSREPLQLAPRGLVGATTARLMMVAEGPGNFEQRTGQPQVSFQVLAGSRCAEECGRFEQCYPVGSTIPQRDCDFIPLETLVQQRIDEAEAELNAEGLDPAGTGLDLTQETRTFRETRMAQSWRLHTAGQLLDQVCLGSGLFRENWNSRLAAIPEDRRRIEPRDGNVYNTNLVKCRSCVPDPTGTGGWKDERPNNEQIEACSIYLQMQRYIIQPVAIVSLGALATETLSGQRVQITRQRGQWMWAGETPLMPELHPAYIIRQTGEEQVRTLTQGMVTSLREALAVAEGREALPTREMATPPQAPAPPPVETTVQLAQETTPEEDQPGQHGEGTDTETPAPVRRPAPRPRAAQRLQPNRAQAVPRPVTRLPAPGNRLPRGVQAAPVTVDEFRANPGVTVAQGEMPLVAVNPEENEE